MPLHVENLRPDSSDDAVKSAVSESISECVREGKKSHKECVAMVTSMARKATGDGAGSLGGRQLRRGLDEGE